MKVIHSVYDSANSGSLLMFLESSSLFKVQTISLARSVEDRTKEEVD